MSGARNSPGALRLVLHPDPIALVEAFGKHTATKLSLTIEAYNDSSNATVKRTIRMMS